MGKNPENVLPPKDGEKSLLGGKEDKDKGYLYTLN